MGKRRTALFSVMTILLFLAACATTSTGPGVLKSAILTVPECLE